MNKRHGERKTRLAQTTAIVSSAPAAPAFDAWMYFLVAGLALALIGVVLLRGQGPAAIGLVVFTLVAAGLVGLAFVGVLGPLVGLGREEGPTIGGRARAALDRDKVLTLRAIKELEFDRAMGKVSEPDFIELRDRLRHRALRLMRQLEGGGVYRHLIERDLAARTRVERTAKAPAVATKPSGCAACSTVNDTDARFCKECGAQLAGSGSGVPGAGERHA